jgi:hypothetical protein
MMVVNKVRIGTACRDMNCGDDEVGGGRRLYIPIGIENMGGSWERMHGVKCTI